MLPTCLLCSSDSDLMHVAHTLTLLTTAQVLAAHNDRESIMPYIEVFKTLIR